MRKVKKKRIEMIKIISFLLLLITFVMLLNPLYVYASCATGEPCSTVGQVKSDPTYCSIQGCSDPVRVCQSNHTWSACYCRVCTDGSTRSCTGYWGSTSNPYNGFQKCVSGQWDAYCQCYSGNTLPFYGGPAGTANVGTCQYGVYLCQPYPDFNAFYVYVNEVTPQTEVCDGLDHDCNGIINDAPGGCDCANGKTQTCYDGTGGTQQTPNSPCKFGTKTCTNGRWSACIGQTVPQPEICDGIDNDCNGILDDDPDDPCCKSKDPCCGQESDPCCKEKNGDATGGE